MSNSELEVEFKQRWEQQYPDLPLLHDSVEGSKLISTWEEYWRWRQEYEQPRAKRYRADFIQPDAKVIVEVHGGIYGTGGSWHGSHNTASALIRDAKKTSLASQAGWLSFPLAGDDMLYQDAWMGRIAETCYARIRSAIEADRAYENIQELEQEVEAARAGAVTLEARVRDLEQEIADRSRFVNANAQLPTDPSDKVAWLLASGRGL